jgi:hypothetical protein
MPWSESFFASRLRASMVKRSRCSVMNPCARSGELLAGMAERGERDPGGRGVSKTESSRWQQLWRLPEEKFAIRLRHAKARVAGMATSSPSYAKAEYTGGYCRGLPFSGIVVAGGLTVVTALGDGRGRRAGGGGRKTSVGVPFVSMLGRGSLWASPHRREGSVRRMVRSFALSAETELLRQATEIRLRAERRWGENSAACINRAERKAIRRRYCPAGPALSRGACGR